MLYHSQEVSSVSRSKNQVENISRVVGAVSTGLLGLIILGLLSRQFDQHH